MFPPTLEFAVGTATIVLRGTVLLIPVPLARRLYVLKLRGTDVVTSPELLIAELFFIVTTNLIPLPPFSLTVPCRALMRGPGLTF